MNAVTWAGSIAGALLAIGTLVRYVIRRMIRAAVWVAAAVQLPEEVARLSDTVDRLTVSVAALATAVDHLPSESLEHL